MLLKVDDVTILLLAVQEERGPRKNKGRRRNSSAKITRLIKINPEKSVQIEGKERLDAVSVLPSFVTNYFDPSSLNPERRSLELTLFSCYKLQRSWNMESHKSAFRKPQQAINGEISYEENITKEGRLNCALINVFVTL